MDSILSHEYFMKLALKEASIAMSEDEVPIGAVIVSNGIVIAKAHNMTERLNDSTAHAEMLAISSAMEHFGSKYLKDCTLYVTLEPCVMCAGASSWAQLGEIVYGASDSRKGFNALASKTLHPKTKIIKGVFEDESTELLHEYFKSKRK